MFCPLSRTENLRPSRTVDGGLVTLVSVRSGPETVVLAVDAWQLLLSFVSGTPRVSSAQVIRKQVPPAVPVLPYTALLRSEVALEASEGTARLPVSRRAPLFEVVVER